MSTIRFPTQKQFCNALLGLAKRENNWIQYCVDTNDIGIYQIGSNYTFEWNDKYIVKIKLVDDSWMQQLKDSTVTCTTKYPTLSSKDPCVKDHLTLTGKRVFEPESMHATLYMPNDKGRLFDSLLGFYTDARVATNFGVRCIHVDVEMDKHKFDLGMAAFKYINLDNANVKREIRNSRITKIVQQNLLTHHNRMMKTINRILTYLLDTVFLSLTVMPPQASVSWAPQTSIQIPTPQTPQTNLVPGTLSWLMHHSTK